MPIPFDEPINKHTDWGGDNSTGYRPVKGNRVQEFIKNSLEERAGYVHYNGSVKKYQMFADYENCQLYLSDPVTYANLLISQFDAPAPYVITTNLVNGSPFSKYVLAGSTNVFLEFSFDIKDSTDSVIQESVLVTYNFTRAGVTQTVTKTFASDAVASLRVDEYLTIPGEYEITINIKGRSTGATKTIVYNWTSVQLTLTSTFSYYRAFAPSTAISVPYRIQGLGQKTIEFYIDGTKYPTDDIVADDDREKTFFIANSGSYAPGKHVLQIRAYTSFDGAIFYSDTLYYEFVISGVEGKFVMLATSFSPGTLISSDLSNLVLPAECYVTSTLHWGYWSSDGLTTSVYFRLNGQSVSIREVSNAVDATDLAPDPLAFIPTTLGLQSLTAVVSPGTASEQTLASYTINVIQNQSGISEATDALTLKLSALGRSNTEPDATKSVWSYGGITTTFNNVQWNAASGWVDDTLVLSNGATAVINFKPFLTNPTIAGATVEIELETFNVEDPDAVVAQLWATDHGIQITSNQALIKSAGGAILSTRFLDSERVKLAFIVNSATSSDNTRFAYIQNNGILERAQQYADGTSYATDANLVLGNASGLAGVKIYSIRCYARALAVNEELNNFMIDSAAAASKIEANDIYLEGTSTVSIDKMMNKLPVLTFEGPMHLLFESSSKETQIHCDITFTNPFDPIRNFTISQGRVKLQGTSSLGYPRKNFKIYMKKDNCVTRDADGNIISEWQMKARAVPCHTFTLKADFSDSSCTHNATVARLYGDLEPSVIMNGTHVLRTPPQTCAATTYQQVVGKQFPYDLRTTPDAFPMVCFYRESANDEWTFMGQYNFLNDKGNDYLYGFRSIYDKEDPWDKTGTRLWDNSNTHCFEVLNNTDAHGFLEWHDSTDFFMEDPQKPGHSLWESCFESRYPEPEGTETKAELDALAESLHTFHAWVCSCYKVDQGGSGSQAKFDAEYEQHCDKYFFASYYSYFMRFGAVDQVNKNMMITTYDGVHWFPIRYDNDTILGQRNDTRLIYDYTINRQTLDPETGDYAYAGHNSYLWNALENCSSFMAVVSEVDAALYSAGLTYDATVQYFDVTASNLWCERVYNDNGRYKYIEPLLGGGRDYTEALQGKRQSHRHWWLRNRFDLYDAFFLTGEYPSKFVRFTIPGAPQGSTFTITAGKHNYYGWGLAKTPQQTGVELDKGQSTTFTLPRQAAVGDPIYIYASPSLQEIDVHNFCPHFSNVIDVSGCWDEVLGTRLKKLVLGDSTNPNRASLTFAGFNKLSRLEELDIRGFQGITSFDLTGMTALKKFYAADSALTSFSCPAGLNFTDLELPASIQSISMNQCTWSSAGLSYAPNTALKNVSFTKMTDANVKGFISDWISALEDAGMTTFDDCTLNLSVPKSTPWYIHDVEGMRAVDWLLKLAKFGHYNITGRFVLDNITAEDITALTAAFGDTIWNLDSPLVVDAQAGFILGCSDNHPLAGESVTFYGVVFPLAVRSQVVFSIQGVSPTVGPTGNPLYIYRNVVLDGTTGVLTSTENATPTYSFIVNGYNTAAGGSTSRQFTMYARSYPTETEVVGESIILSSGDYTYTLRHSAPSDYTGSVSNVEWFISGVEDVSIISMDSEKFVIRVGSVNSEYVWGSIRAVVHWKNGSSTANTKSAIFHEPTEVASVDNNMALIAEMREQHIIDIDATSLYDIDCFLMNGSGDLSIIANPNIISLSGTAGAGHWYPYFTRVPKLILTGCSNLQGIIDLSGNTNFTFVDLNNCLSISGIKLNPQAGYCNAFISRLIHVPAHSVLDSPNLIFDPLAVSNIELDNCFNDFGNEDDLFHWWFYEIFHKQSPYAADAFVLDASTSTPITFWLQNNGACHPNCEYSLNGAEWYPVPTTAEDAVTAVDVAGKATPLYLRGDNIGAGKQNTWSMSAEDYSVFQFSGGPFRPSGDITHLLNGSGTGTGGVLNIPNYCFYQFFKDCAQLMQPVSISANMVGAYSFASFYENCDNLILPGSIPATTLGAHCFERMFYGCDSLIECASLVADTAADSSFKEMYAYSSISRVTSLSTITTLAPHCFESMFEGCVSFPATPSLPATTLADSCYKSMFKGCTGFSSASGLSSSVILAESCCESMYEDCTNLTSAPSLSATILAPYCYKSMFKGCSKITNPPALPATLLAVYCYSNMFQKCVKLTKSPALPALVLTSGCYYEMFRGCRALTQVTASFRVFTDATTNWLVNVASSGTFDGQYSVTAPEERNASTIPFGWSTMSMRPKYAGLNITNPNTNTIILNLPNEVSLFYSFDGGETWTDTQTAGGQVEVPGKATISFAGYNDGLDGHRAGWTRSTSAIKRFIPKSYVGTYLRVSGNIMSLINKDNFLQLNEIPCAYCFYRLFSDSGYNLEGISSIEGLALTATILKPYCYAHMFEWTKGFTIPADFILPATTLAEGCYQYMFSGVTSIRAIPSGLLPATTLAPYCYNYMFDEAGGVTNAPDLPATTLAPYCYANMFAWCYSLTSAPALPATTLASYCYDNMFLRCTSLTSAPALPATVVPSRAYQEMFRYCTALVIPPTFPDSVVTIGSYGCSGMFSYCSALTSIPDMIVSAGELSFNGAFTYCSSLKDLSANTITVAGTGRRSFFEMFLSLSNLVKAPAIRYTEGAVLSADETFMNCFRYCSNLSDISGIQFPPVLKGVSNYSLMFQGCNLQTLVPHQFSGCTFAEKDMASPFNSSGLRTLPSNLFYNCTVSVNGGITNLFAGCPNITEIPGDLIESLTLTGTGSLRGMFAGMTGVTTVGSGLFDNVTFSNYPASMFESVFSGCTHLVNVPDDLFIRFDAASSTGMFNYAFNNCTSLVTPPAIAVTAAASSFNYTFQNCTSLTSLPSLDSIQSMTGNAFEGMYQGCTSLASIPSNYLPLTALSTSCYKSMFRDCTSLVDVPSVLLHSTSLAESCYSFMFSGCISLVVPPALPATVLAANCYNSMFQGCTSIVTPPALSITTYSTRSLAFMYQNCTSLTSVPDITFNEEDHFNAFYGMFAGCTALEEAWDVEGSFPMSIRNQTEEFAYLFSGCTSLVRCSDFCRAISSQQSGADVNSQYAYTFNDCVNLETFPTHLWVQGVGAYHFDHMFTNCKKMVTPPAFRQPLYILYQSYQACYYMFSGCTALTSIPSLRGMSVQNSTMYNYFYSMFRGMFKDCTSLVDLRGLMFQTFNVSQAGSCDYGFAEMFSGCTNLQYLWDPEVPGDACKFTGQLNRSNAFNSIFANCSSLLQLPSFSALTQGTRYTVTSPFVNAFAGCSSLVTAPLLPTFAVSTSNSFQNAFKDCTSLTSFPTGFLSGVTTVGVQSFESMFENCTSLVNPPDIFDSLTSVGNYGFRNMFKGCSALATVPNSIVPAIKSTTQHTHYGMFQNCTSLTDVSNLVLSTALCQYCYSHMFDGCTSLTAHPTFPESSNTAKGSYSYMFNGCTSLTSAIINNTKGTTESFAYMFNGCSDLASVLIRVDAYSTSAFQSWLASVADSGVIIKPISLVLPVNSSSGQPHGWTLQPLS